MKLRKAKGSLLVVILAVSVTLMPGCDFVKGFQDLIGGAIGKAMSGFTSAFSGLCERIGGVAEQYGEGVTAEGSGQLVITPGAPASETPPSNEAPVETPVETYVAEAPVEALPEN